MIKFLFIYIFFDRCLWRIQDSLSTGNIDGEATVPSLQRLTDEKRSQESKGWRCSVTRGVMWGAHGGSKENQLPCEAVPQSCSNCGPQLSSVAWEVIRSAHFHPATPQTYGISHSVGGASHVCFNKPSDPSDTHWGGWWLSYFLKEDQKSSR